MDDMMLIMNWINTDFNKLTLGDQLLVAAEFANFAEKLKPIYERYHTVDPEEESLRKFLNKLWGNETEDDKE